MHIDIWSDVVCPWCYIGKRRLEQALTQFAHRDSVEIRWHSFELDPSAPGAREGTYASRLAAKYGVPEEQARQMLDEMTARAAELGLTYDFSIAQHANTFDAHRVLHLAHERGVQDAVEERLFRAMFTEGRALGDAETLISLAAEAGLEADEVRAVLATDRYADAVRADEAQAVQLGVTGVPFFVIDRRYGVAGAQPADVLLRVLDGAWAQRAAA